SNIRFVVLDTYDPGEFDTTGDSPERDWLLEEVQKPEFTAADWQIVVFHNPPYSSDAASDAVKTHLVPVFRANGVDMVFSGHAHFYERYEYQKYGYANDPIVQYIVTGGGGAPLVPIGAEPTDDDVERVCELKAFHHTIIDVDVPGKSLTLTAVDINGTPFDTVTLTLDGPRQLSQEAPPTAQLISPSDGLSDPEDEFEDDFDRDPNEVLVNTAPTSFKIQLVDPDEIDDDSVTSSAVRIVKDGVTMSPSDYVFEYQVQQDDQIRLTRPGGAAFDRGVYEIRLNDTPTITDTQDCAMLPTVLTVVVEPSWGSVDLVPEGSTWEYLVTPSEPSPDQGGNTWRDPLFDHSWPSGAAQLGYSYDPPENDEATFLGFGGNPNDKYITTYFRHTFNVDKTSNHLDLLSLSLVRDDGAIVYLNGIEVKRTNMPTTGTIGWSSLASGGVGGTEESTWREPLALDPSLLVQGSNVLAVEIHQRSATSSDISLDLELKAFGSKITTNAFDPEVGLLEVYGTTGDDEIALSVNGSDHVTLNGQELSGPVDADDVTEIKVYGYAGNDTIDLSGVDDADFTALAAS
ncbi:MAG TPA: metallophosphoesterase, partial [Candidatus Paceibacterota bacterium]|nr:metallophosphoesterase [Candidatus Paceibacterota bacterium]